LFRQRWQTALNIHAQKLSLWQISYKVIPVGNH
jgi:hypothetical protein